MSAVTTERGERLPVHVTGARATGWWGMLLFIVAELVLFASLLAAYFYLRFEAPTWPPDGTESPDLLLGGIASLILLGSSVPVWWGERRLRRDGDPIGIEIGFAVAVVMALVFLGIQVHEYQGATFDWRTHAYGSLFFTITGFHGAHVLVGILISSVTQARAWCGHFDREHMLPVENAAVYWHFVDVVWVLIFVSLYLSPYL